MPLPTPAAAAASAVRDMGVFSPQVVQVYLIWSRVHPHSEQSVTSSGTRRSWRWRVALSVSAKMRWSDPLNTLLTRLNHVHEIVLEITCRFRRRLEAIIKFSTLIPLKRDTLGKRRVSVE